MILQYIWFYSGQNLSDVHNL